MKAIIYAGIGLFSVASVYGVADYYSSNKQGDLNDLYADEKVQPESKIEETKSTVLQLKDIETVNPENGMTTVKNSSTKKEKRAAKKLKAEDYSRAIIPETEELKIVTEEPIKKTEEIITEKKELTPAAAVSPKEENTRTITLERFSRAPLKKQVRPAKKTVVKTKG